MNQSIDYIKRHFDNHLPKHWQEQWLLFVLQKPFNFLITDVNYRLNSDEYQRYQTGIQAMQQGTPLAYLMGTAYFWSLPFNVNEHTLIPRADSELVVEIALQLADNLPAKQSSQDDKPSIQLLDLGTGSGCLGLAIKKSLDDKGIDSHMTACDNSLEALMVAKSNAKQLNITAQFIKSDWFSAIDGTFNLIIANPPYIAYDDEHLSDLSAEPITALVADDNGLSDIAHIIRHAYAYLDGYLVIEHGYNQAKQVQHLLTQAGFKKITTCRDYGGNDRVTYGLYGDDKALTPP